jgi:hypothetical protein
MEEQYVIGVDPCSKADRIGTSFVFKGLDEVVAAYKSRPITGFADEVRKIAGFFATRIVPETGLFQTEPFYEPVYQETEDAVVISIKTVPQ